VLDITVHGSTADITASYKLKNTTDQSIELKPMFLAPDMEYSQVKIEAKGQELNFETKSYSLNYDSQITTQDWQYAVLTDDEISDPTGQIVDTVSFWLDFAPQEEYEVKVSYLYRLGGYPDYDFDAKRGDIEYYLTPAAMWKDFSNLTINLQLDQDMPVLKSSNLEFEKIGKRQYQYQTDTLPAENLRLVIDENWWQNIFSTLKSPYFFHFGFFIIIVIILILAAAFFIGWRLIRRKHS
jgi:hypothetical protein